MNQGSYSIDVVVQFAKDGDLGEVEWWFFGDFGAILGEYFVVYKCFLFYEIRSKLLK